MGFSDSFSQYIAFMFVTGWVGLLLGIKLLKTIDDSGEGRKDASTRFAEWLRKRFE